MLKILTMAALAFAAPGAAHAATDGAPGATSTGSFTATLNVSPPTGTQVQIVGLDDLTISSLTLNADGTLPGLYGYADFVCFNRSDAGQVSVTLTQTSGAVDRGSTIFSVVETADTNGNGSFDTIPIAFQITEPSGADIVMENDIPIGMQASAAGCTASTPMPDAHRIAFRLDNSSIGVVYSPGNYVGQFTIVIAPI